MEQIEILDEPPIIFTKDKEWHKRFAEERDCTKPGRIILLPEDAVLARAPRIMEIKSEIKP